MADFNLAFSTLQPNSNVSQTLRTMTQSLACYNGKDRAPPITQGKSMPDQVPFNEYSSPRVGRRKIHQSGKSFVGRDYVTKISLVMHTLCLHASAARSEAIATASATGDLPLPD